MLWTNRANQINKNPICHTVSEDRAICDNSRHCRPKPVSAPFQCRFIQTKGPEDESEPGKIITYSYDLFMGTGEVPDFVSFRFALQTRGLKTSR